jgi:hypothetical protein
MLKCALLGIWIVENEPPYPGKFVKEEIKERIYWPHMRIEIV